VFLYIQGEPIDLKGGWGGEVPFRKGFYFFGRIAPNKKEKEGPRNYITREGRVAVCYRSASKDRIWGEREGERV